MVYDTVKILQIIKTVQKNLQVSLKYIFTVSVWEERDARELIGRSTVGAGSKVAADCFCPSPLWSGDAAAPPPPSGATPPRSRGLAVWEEEEDEDEASQPTRFYWTTSEILRVQSLEMNFLSSCFLLSCLFSSFF